MFVDEELTSHPGEKLMGRMGHHVCSAPVEADRGERRSHAYHHSALAGFGDVHGRGHGKAEETGLQFRAFEPFLCHAHGRGGKDQSVGFDLRLHELGVHLCLSRQDLGRHPELRRIEQHVHLHPLVFVAVFHGPDLAPLIRVLFRKPGDFSTRFFLCWVMLVTVDRKAVLFVPEHKAVTA